MLDNVLEAANNLLEMIKNIDLQTVVNIAFGLLLSILLRIIFSLRSSHKKHKQNQEGFEDLLAKANGHITGLQDKITEITQTLSNKADQQGTNEEFQKLEQQAEDLKTKLDTLDTGLKTGAEELKGLIAQAKSIGQEAIQQVKTGNQLASDALIKAGEALAISQQALDGSEQAKVTAERIRADVTTEMTGQQQRNEEHDSSIMTKIEEGNNLIKNRKKP